MNSNYTLRKRILNPSELLPSDELLFASAIGTLRAGDYVDLGIERPALDGSGTAVLVENICVKITEAHSQRFDGVVHESTHFHAHHGVHVGDTIRFEPHHVFDIISVKTPMEIARLKFLAQVLRLSRAFLAELPTVEEIPADGFTGCVIDSEVTVMMRRNGDDVMVVIEIAIIKAGATAGELAAAQRYSVAFTEAAERLDIACEPPDFDGPSDYAKPNCLIVRVPVATPGQRLIQMVVDTVVAVHQEARRDLAERAEPGMAGA